MNICLYDTQFIAPIEWRVLALRGDEIVGMGGPEERFRVWIADPDEAGHWSSRIKIKRTQHRISRSFFSAVKISRAINCLFVGVWLLIAHVPTPSASHRSFLSLRTC